MSEITFQKEELALGLTQFAVKAGHAKGLIEAEVGAFSVLK